MHGNEASARHHTDGKLIGNGDTNNIEVVVPEGSNSFDVSIWNEFSDTMAYSLQSPTGETIERVSLKPDTTLEVELQNGGSTVKIEKYFLSLASGSQLTRVEILDPIPGVWKITIYGEIILNGTYHAWLPITGLISPGIEFVNSTPNYTIVVPATATETITCGAYNNINNTLYENSSWGPTRTLVNSPDIVAPGVEVTGIYPNNILGTMTGTSISASITAGAGALMLQWGIVEGNDITINTSRIRAFLIRGAIREPNTEYPSMQWGYGKLNLINTFNELRP